MMSVTSGYLIQGDMSQGGTAVKIDFSRCGREEPAKKDTYKAVFDDDGKRSHPKIESNKLRVKGELYFRGMEITGVDTGSDKKPKWALKAHFRDTLFGKLEQAVADAEESNGGWAVVVDWAWDGAGPHTHQQLATYLGDEFSRRGWIYGHQPSQSPVTNIHDQCIFPSMSKHVSTESAVRHGKRCLREEEIWSVSSRVWETMPLTTIARAFSSQPQVQAAVIASKGGNEFLRGSGQGHYGVRKAYVECPGGSGICLLKDEQGVEIGRDILKYEVFEKEHALFDFSDMQMAAIYARGRTLRLLRNCFGALKATRCTGCSDSMDCT